MALRRHRRSRFGDAVVSAMAVAWPGRGARRAGSTRWRAGRWTPPGLAVVLPVLSLGLFAAAVFVSRGRRRQALSWVGFGLIFAGVVVLVARRLLGTSVVEALMSTDAVRPAASAAWTVGTGLLRDVAQATVIIGIPVFGAALLPVLVMIAVVIVGVVALRRQTAQEFPPAVITEDESTPVLAA